MIEQETKRGWEWRHFNWRRRALLIGAILVVLSLSLLFWLQGNPHARGEIVVSLAEGRVETLSFADLALLPGQESAYTVHFKTEWAPSARVQLSFHNLDESLTLARYARVRITAGDATLYDELLSVAFEGEPLFFEADFQNKKNTTLRVIYYLPIEVGNEAKNAAALFDLRVSATNE